MTKAAQVEIITDNEALATLALDLIKACDANTLDLAVPVYSAFKVLSIAEFMAVMSSVIAVTREFDIKGTS
jgi:hypothetical protein